MTDREKVANGLRHCLHYNGSCFDCPYDGPNCQNDVLDDALALLKEQPEIVRCKDCWKREFDNCPFYEYSMVVQEDNFFCADGERRYEND